MRAPSFIHGKVSRRVRLPLLFGALASVVGVILIWLAQLNNDTIRWQSHTLQVENALSDLTNAVNQAEAVQRGYLLTGQADNFLRIYDRARANIPVQLDWLQAQTQDDASERAAIPGVRLAVQRKFQELDGAVALRKAGHATAAQVSVNDGSTRALTRDVLRAVAGMRQTEEALLAERTRQREVLNVALLGAVAAGGVLVLLFAWLWIEQARRTGRDLEIAYAELSAANEVLIAEMASRQAAENQMRQMQKMEAVGQLTGGIAHDFNNMLAVIIGNLNLVQRRLAKDQTQVGGFVESAMEGANRAAALTNRLLAFARQQPLAPEPIDLNQLVRSMSQLLTRTLGQPIVVETVLGVGLWRTRADAAQLENALINLAINARDAMPAGGRLTIRTANSELDPDDPEAGGAAPGQYVMVAVSDIGHGMTPEVLDKALEPFFTTKPVGKGTGLGLSQVYGFVKQSGGRLNIQSRVGQGTTVTIYLPRLTTGDSATDPPPS